MPDRPNHESPDFRLLNPDPHIKGLVRRDHYLIGEEFLDEGSEALINRNVLVTSLRYRKDKLVRYLHVDNEHFVMQVSKPCNVTRASLLEHLAPFPREQHVDSSWHYENRSAQDVLEIDAYPNVYLSFRLKDVNQVLLCTHTERPHKKDFYVFLMIDEVSYDQ